MMVGKCPVCDLPAPIVNYALERGREVGYLGRHGRPGVRKGAKCRGSFGGWVKGTAAIDARARTETNRS